MLTVQKKRKNIPGRGRANRKMNMGAMMQNMMSLFMGRGRGRGGMRGRGRGGPPPPRGGIPPT